MSARPIQTLALTGVLTPLPAQLFTDLERNNLLFDGISTFLRDIDGTVRIERAITSYQTNAAGAVDPSYLDVETMFTAARLRFDTSISPSKIERGPAGPVEKRTVRQLADGWWLWQQQDWID